MSKPRTTSIAKMAKQLPPPQTAAAVSEASAIINMIERAARDPSVDIDKMQRLLDMRSQVARDAARVAFNTALAQMQNELPPIPERGHIKDGAGKLRSSYALWEDVNEVIKPVLHNYGFSLTFRIDENPAGKIAVTGVLAHSDGHEITTTITLPVDLHASRNVVQSHASSVSYGKRYTAAALLNLTSRGEDDDGVSAGAGEVITIEQAEELIAIARKAGRSGQQLLAYVNSSHKLSLTEIADLPKRLFETVHDQVKTAAAKVQA